jgi:DNA-binding MarR family transcriptional regulator
MENKKLIVRKKDQNDGRLVRIFLTPLGKQKKEIAKDTVRTFNQLIHQKIPKEKLLVFTDVIERIHEIIHTGELNKMLNAD